MSLLFRLPNDIRAFLKNPYGPVFAGNGPEVAKLISKKLPDLANVISVGDVTTFNLFSAGIFPRICVIDDFTKRRPFDIKSFNRDNHPEFYSKLTVNNPAGFLSDDLIYSVGHAISSNFFTKIIVEGEEDLASLPAIAFAPVGSVILYGQPDKGMVFVEVTKSSKEHSYSLVDEILNIENLDLSEKTDIQKELVECDLYCVRDFCKRFK
ncbi:MAG: DUF359 domain-containing protein [Methanosarcinaceae archaeon]|nr:DUF359 domain-containing protein [Methanosarcinaceae archaeon]